MARKLPGNPSQDKVGIHVPEEPKCFARKWYFSRQELEDHSPSRKDGIGQEEESYLRKLYCSFLQELGMELKVPQVTIATAMMLCHQFYMRQSHAKNCWQIQLDRDFNPSRDSIRSIFNFDPSRDSIETSTHRRRLDRSTIIAPTTDCDDDSHTTIATVCMLLGCKAEETSRWLSDITVEAYKLMYKWDPSAPRRIKQKEVYDKQKELILNGEIFLLATLAFDLNIEHPYKPLVGALKRLEISDKELTKVAWNFVNDWLHTTLCLQYKPHYIAAGSIFLAAKIRKVKLPKEKGNVWWMQFDVSPKHLGEVVQQMMGLVEQNRKQTQPLMRGKGTAPKPIAGAALSSNPQSCILSGSVAPVCGIFITKVNAEGPDDSVSSKCDEKQVFSDVQDTLKPISGKAVSGSPQSSIPSGSVVAPDSCNLTSMTKAEWICNSVSSICNEPQACSDVQDTLKETRLLCQTSDSSSADSVVEDCEGEPVREKSDLNSSCKIVSIEGSHGKIDVNRIRETFRKRRQDRIKNRNLIEDGDDEMDNEGWIERELENGIKLESPNADKRRRL